MNRRKICSYSVSLAAGIAIASHALEDGFFGSAFLLSLLAAGTCLLLRTCGEEIGPDRDQVRGMLVCLTAGMLVFSRAWLVTRIDDRMLEQDRVPEFLTGTVLSSAAKKEYNEYTLICELPSGRRKVLCRDRREEIGLPDPGQILIIGGELRLPACRRNPGCFDYRKYLRSKGIVYTVTVKSCRPEGTDPRLFFRFSSLLACKRRGFTGLLAPGDAGGLIRGAVFGDRTGLSEEVYEEFRANGTAHILAVSGLHVGFLLSIVQRLTKGRRSFSALLLVTGILTGYGFLTAWNVPTVRAVLIALAALYSSPADRPFDMTAAIAASSMIQLLLQPYLLFQAGFLLSYLAVAGMAFLTEPLSHFIGRTLAGLLSLQLAIVPYMAASFNHWNPVSIVINIPVIFLASLLIPASVLCFVFYLAAGGLPVWITDWITELSEWEIRLNHDLYGHGSLDRMVVSPETGIVLTVLALVFLLSSETVRILILRGKKRTIARLCLLVTIPLAVYGFSVRNLFREDEIVFVDVGQGDCTHLRTGRIDVLIDGGGSVFYNVGEQVLMPYLLKNRVSDIDFALVTHLHTDHYLGIVQLADRYPVNAVGIPSEYRKSIEDQTARRDSGSGEDDPMLKLPDTIQYISPGCRICLAEDVCVEPVWPAPGTERDVSVEDPNENNMVYRICYGDYRILVTGDLLEEDEREMVDYYQGTDVLKCDVLKVAHHGSRSSSCEAFLDAADPVIAVIQVGENNLYGHPHETTLTRLEERGIRIYRTDQDGAVGLDLKRNRMRVDTMIHRSLVKPRPDMIQSNKQ